jgi:hypothetical protein
MMKKIACVLGSAVLSASAFAEVPFTFQSGTPAKAAEVNDNFTALSNEIEKLSDAINNGVSPVADNCPDPETGIPTDTDLTYTPKDAALGTLLNDEGTIVLAKLPFYEFASGKKYSITLPVNHIIEFDTPVFRAHLDSSPVDPVAVGCALYTVDGYDVIAQSGLVDQGIGVDFDTSWEGETSHTTQTLYHGISSNDRIMNILVGGTVVQFTLPGPSLSENRYTTGEITNGDYDLTDNVDVVPAIDPIIWHQHFDAMIDYIKIEEVQ